MKIKWLGHASFLITSDAGVRIITDPYIPGNNLKYGEIKEKAEIVTVSHEHYDHNNVATVGGNPEVIKGPVNKEVKGIKFTGVPAYHDKASGKERGANTIFLIIVDELRVCHLGDLGHPLAASDLTKLGKVDILLIPVGGYYTVDAAVATEVSQRLAPRIIIPMHYKNEKCSFPIAGVDEFLKGKANVVRLNTSEAEFKRAALPPKAQIMVLEPAL